MGIPPERSDFESLDGHWEFQRKIQISTAHLGIRHSTGAFRFRMIRRALEIPPERSDSEFSDGHWAFHLNIQVWNAHMGIGHSTGAFRFRMRR